MALYHLLIPKIMTDICGKPEEGVQRIIGGEIVKPGEHPWVAYIHLPPVENEDRFCGGSLISKL